MGPEFLSVTPQRLRCYVCGTFTESADGWSYRTRLGGHSPVCPSCTSRVEQEIEQQTGSPNLVGAVVLGTLAAAVGGTAWSLAAGAEQVFAVVGIGIGWLVGKAVALGSGNKRGPVLQLAAGVLTGAGILGGRYLILNHLVSKLARGGFSGWLSWKQFLTLYGRLLAHGEEGIIEELLILLVAVSTAVALAHADKLVSKPPRRIRGWPRLTG